MPVRSLHSSVLKWPDARTVDQAVRAWARKVVVHRHDVLRIGYFGSYADGRWGVGSDLDVVIVVESSSQPFEKRGLEWNTNELPVPIDLFVYTKEEWDFFHSESQKGPRFLKDTIWVYLKR